MPNRDKTGPEGEGPETGRGKGKCKNRDKPSEELREDKVVVDEVGLGRGGKPRHLRRQRGKRSPLDWLERAL